jgi:hypothetical protein
VRIGTRCLLDGLGLFVAGSEEHSVRLLIEEAEQTGGRPDALLLGRGAKKVPAPWRPACSARRAMPMIGMTVR